MSHVVPRLVADVLFDTVCDHARGPGVEKSLDAARRSACATSATTCPTLAHPVSATSGGLRLVSTLSGAGLLVFGDDPPSQL